MKKLLFVFAFAFVVACSSDDDTPEAAMEIAITELDATGTVAQQTVTEAKKTIYGKWDIASSSKSISSAKSNSCAFDYIEFTDNDYIMALNIAGETITVFGSYVMNDNAAGNVESVSLNFNLGTSEVTIATLTNIVVTESGDDLNASFDVVLSIPEDSELEFCNSLSGDYSASKDEPLAASNSATADTNHAKLIHTWNLVSFVSEGEDITSELKMEPCYDYETDGMTAGCTPATSISISFSTFGTYSFVLLGSSEGTYVDTDSWDWTDASQTSFYVGSPDEERIVATITSISDSSMVISDSEGGVLTFSR